MGGEDVVEDRQSPDLAQARRRLRAADEDPGVGEVDVAFEHVADLVGAGAGEDQRADDRFSFIAKVPRIAIQFAGRIAGSYVQDWVTSREGGEFACARP